MTSERGINCEVFRKTEERCCLNQKLGLLVCTLATVASTASLTGCTTDGAGQHSAVSSASTNAVSAFQNTEANLTTAQQNGTLTSQSSLVVMYPTVLDALQIGIGDTGTSARDLHIGQVKKFNNNYIVAYTYNKGSNTYISISNITKMGNAYTAELNGVPETGKPIDSKLLLSSIRVQTNDWSAFAGFVKNPSVSAVRLIFKNHVEVSKLSADDRLFIAASYGAVPLDLHEIDLLDSKMNIIKRITPSKN